MGEPADGGKSELAKEKELRQKAEAEILRLEAEIIFTRKDGEDTVKEVARLKKALDKTTQELEAAKQAEASTQANLGQSQQQLAGVQAQLAAAAEQQAAELQKQQAQHELCMYAVQQAAGKLEGQLQEKDSALAAVQQANQQMLEQLQQDATALTELDNDLQDSEQRGSQAQIVADALRTELSREMEHSQRLQEGLDDTLAQVESLKASVEAASLQAKEAQEALRVAREEATARLEVALQEAKAEQAAAEAVLQVKLDIALAEATRERERLEAEKASAASGEESRARAQKAANRILQKEVEDLRHRVSHCEEERKEHIKKLQDFAQQRAGIDRVVRGLQEQRDKLQADLDAAEHDREQLRQGRTSTRSTAFDKLEEANRQIEALQHKLLESQCELSELRRQGSTPRGAEASQEVSALHQEVKELRNKLQQQSQASATARETNSGEVETLRAQLVAARVSAQERASRETDLQKTVASLKDELRQARQGRQVSVDRASLDSASRAESEACTASQEIKLHQQILGLEDQIVGLEDEKENHRQILQAVLEADSIDAGSPLAGGLSSGPAPLSELYARVRDIGRARRIAEKRLADAKAKLAAQKSQRDTSERSQQIDSPPHGRHMVDTEASTTEAGRQDTELVVAMSHLFKQLVPKAEPDPSVHLLWSAPERMTMPLEEPVPNLGCAEGSRPEILSQAASVRAAIQKKLDMVLSELHHCQRMKVESEKQRDSLMRILQTRRAVTVELAGGSDPALPSKSAPQASSPAVAMHRQGRAPVETLASGSSGSHQPPRDVLQWSYALDQSFESDSADPLELGASLTLNRRRPPRSVSPWEEEDDDEAEEPQPRRVAPRPSVSPRDRGSAPTPSPPPDGQPYFHSPASTAYVTPLAADGEGPSGESSDTDSSDEEWIMRRISHSPRLSGFRAFSVGSSAKGRSPTAAPKHSPAESAASAPAPAPAPAPRAVPTEVKPALGTETGERGVAVGDKVVHCRRSLSPEDALEVRQRRRTTQSWGLASHVQRVRNLFQHYDDSDDSDDDPGTPQPVRRVTADPVLQSVRRSQAPSMTPVFQNRLWSPPVSDPTLTDSDGGAFSPSPIVIAGCDSPSRSRYLGRRSSRTDLWLHREQLME